MHKRNFVWLSLFLMTPLCSAAELPGAVVARLLADLQVPTHPTIQPLAVESHIQKIDHPAVVLEFDHRIIQLNAPLRKLTIRRDLPARLESDEEEKNPHLCDLQFVGDTWKLNVAVNAEDTEQEAIYPPFEGGCFVDIYFWRHTFAGQFRSLKVMDERLAICRDHFSFETGTESVIFGPKPTVLANVRLFTTNYSTLEKKATDSLAGAGYSRELVEKTLADLQTEFATMSDLDFHMQMLKSDGPALPAETDLKKALRAMYLQCSFDIEYAFTTKINTMNTLVIKSNIEASRERYPFFYHVSMMDEKGHEVHWINYRLKEKMEPQAFADRLATLMVDKKKMAAK